jgi:hypothetical protein
MMDDLARRELESEAERLHGEVHDLRESIEDAYTIMDRYADEVSDDAYQLLESIFIDALNNDSKSK